MSESKYKILKEFKETIQNAMKTGILNVEEKENREVYMIAEMCGNYLNQFIWKSYEKISQGDFIKLLKLMPNLTNLKLRSMKLDDEELEENPKKKLKLDLDILKNLKSLDVDDESFLNFFSSNFDESFLKKLSLGYRADYKELINVTSPVQELLKKLEVFSEEEVKEIFKFSNLEDLRIFLTNYEEDFIKEISTLKNLKVLKFDECFFNHSVQNWQFLEDLENLEKLSFTESDLNVSFLRDLKLKSLRKLSLDAEGHDFIFEDFSINSPNLNVLKVRFSPHKINFYAEYFKDLEKLHLEFDFSDKGNSIEFDTGIINESLKTIKLKYFRHNNEVNDLLEIVEIFPNLESIEIEWHDCNAPLFANKFLFKKLNKLKNLKSLKINNMININRCKEFITDGELIDDLKSLSKKLESYDIKLGVVSDKVRFYEKFNIHRVNRNEKSNYDIFTTGIEKENFKLFVNYLRELFEVVSDSDYLYCNLRK